MFYLLVNLTCDIILVGYLMFVAWKNNETKTYRVAKAMAAVFICLTALYLVFYLLSGRG